jgi:hypothetical protein
MTHPIASPEEVGMPVYVRKRGVDGYFLGYASPLQPLIGSAEWALPFPSAEAAYACTPAILHADIEVVEESARRKDTQVVYRWPTALDPPMVSDANHRGMHEEEVS